MTFQQQLSRVARWAAWPVVILAVASIAFVAAKVPANEQFSPYDEYVYLDYLHKVPSQLIVHRNEETGDFARNEISCRGVIDYGAFGQACNIGAHEDDSEYPYTGRTGADIYTPAYFVITWALAQPATWGGVGLLDAGRLTGALWLAAGTILLYLTMRRLGVGTSLSLGLSLAVIATPMAYWSSTYLSTDAPALAVGAALGYAGVRIAQKDWSPWWFVPIAVLSTLIKVQNLAAVGLVVLAVVAYLATRADESVTAKVGVRARIVAALRQPTTVVLAVSIVVSVALQGIWLVIRARVALDDGGIVFPAIDALPLSIGGLVNESLKFLFNVGFTGMTTGISGEIAWHLITALSLAGVIGILISARAQPVAAVVIAGTTLLIALVNGPALSLAAYFLAGYYFPLPLRYGYILLPALVVCAALFLADRKWVARGGLLAGGALALLAILP